MCWSCCASLECVRLANFSKIQWILSLQWCHDGRDGVSNHQPHHYLRNRLFRRREKKTPKLRVTDLSAGNSQVTGEFPAQMASNAENASIWWRHHVWKLHCGTQSLLWLHSRSDVLHLLLLYYTQHPAIMGMHYDICVWRLWKLYNVKWEFWSFSSW